MGKETRRVCYNTMGNSSLRGAKDITFVYRSGAPSDSFQAISVRKAQNRLRYTDLITVKARDFF